jgi:hypothetical protein
MLKYLALFGAIFGKLSLWLKGQIVSDVPPEDALCEFDCRKRNCQFGDWSNCANRLSYLALESSLTARISNEQPPIEAAALANHDRQT